MEPSADLPEDEMLRYCQELLRPYARRLNSRFWRILFLPPLYDILSDALIWIDERPLFAPSDIVEGLKPLYHYRTGLILGEARPYAACWAWGRKMFPNWVGFHPTRCKPSRRYKRIYRVRHIATLRCLDEIERAADTMR